MQLKQFTDEQLIAQINYLGTEILATSSDEPGFDRLSEAYDRVVFELTDRGIWE